MPGALTHSPADVVAQLLVDLGHGTDPDDGGAWPVSVANEPDTPDQAITVYDTAGRDGGRVMPGGERQEHHGVQVRVRARTHKAGYVKARAIAVALDQDVYDDHVTVDDAGADEATYLVHCVNRVGDVIALGRNVPASKRLLFTINALVSLRST